MDMEVSRTRRRGRIEENQADHRSVIYDMVVIFILLHFLGFPGKLTSLFGEKIETLVDYGCFGLEIVVMLLSSGNTYLDVKLIDLKSRYVPVYVYTLFLFLNGVMLSTERSAAVITGLRLFTLALFAVWIMDRYTIKHFLELAYIAQIGILLFTMFLIARGKGYSDYEGVRALTGIHSTKNSAAGELSFSLLLQLTLLRLKWDDQESVSLTFLGVLGLNTVFLLLSKGTGALFCSAVPAVYVLVIERKKILSRRLPLGFIFVLLSIGFLIFALTIIPLFEPILEKLGKDATLTGRIPLWERIITITMDNRPLFGFGYERLWKEKVPVDLIHAGFASTSWFAKMTAGSHSLLIELLGSTGIAGLGVYYLIVILCFQKIEKMKEEDYIFCSAFMLVYTLHGLTERGMSPTSYYTLFFFMTMAVACRNEKQPKQQKRKAKRSE